MHVNIFISSEETEQPRRLLVLPIAPDAAIPSHLRDVQWRHFARTMTGDKLLGATAESIEADIDRLGYALVSPTG